jgi:hypothetical protein
MPFLGEFQIEYKLINKLKRGRTGPDLLISTPNEVKIPNELDGKPVDMNKELLTENAEFHLNRMLKRRIKMWDVISLYPTE